MRTWPEGAILVLQDCFECSDWDIFREAATYSDTVDLEEYTTSVTSYISKCIEDVTAFKTVITYANHKPWFSAKLRNLMKVRDSAFKSKNREAYTTARADLSWAIKDAKRQYAHKINTHFTSTKDTRRMWHGIQTITGYKPTPPACSSDPSLPDKLNDFFARFETEQRARKEDAPLTQ